MKRFSKKMQINKKTISKLNDMELFSVKGGSNYCGQGSGGTNDCGTQVEGCNNISGGSGGSAGSSYGCGSSNCGTGATSPLYCTSGMDTTCSGLSCPG